MQPAALSQSQLISLMNLLKQTLAYFDNRHSHNVAFFDDWCFYEHICNFNIPYKQNIPKGKKRKQATVGALLDVLEPYIPFRLSDENFDMFMRAAFRPEEPSTKLVHKARLDFVMALRDIKEPSQWEQTLSVCEAIRALKEELAPLR